LTGYDLSFDVGLLDGLMLGIDCPKDPHDEEVEHNVLDRHDADKDDECDGQDLVGPRDYL